MRHPYSELEKWPTKKQRSNNAGLGLGFEPRLAESESAGLPWDFGPASQVDDCSV
jgi:hypothetical protein